MCRICQYKPPISIKAFAFTSLYCIESRHRKQQKQKSFHM